MGIAMTTSPLPPRLDLLARMVARQGGEWTPARVARAYEAHICDAPKRTTHRGDLKRLRDLGILDRRETPGRTYYVPSRRVMESGVAA